MKMVYKGNPMLRKKHQRVDAIQHDNTRSSVDIFPMCTCGPVLFLVKCTASLCCVELVHCFSLSVCLSYFVVHRANPINFVGCTCVVGNADAAGCKRYIAISFFLKTVLFHCSPSFASA